VQQPHQQGDNQTADHRLGDAVGVEHTPAGHQLATGQQHQGSRGQCAKNIEFNQHGYRPSPVLTEIYAASRARRTPARETLQELSEGVHSLQFKNSSASSQLPNGHL
jgi:hypothetical protein